jgi:hypothetical protein
MTVTIWGWHVAAVLTLVMVLGWTLAERANVRAGRPAMGVRGLVAFLVTLWLGVALGWWRS